MTPADKMESPKNIVSVNIYGEEYRIRAEGDVEYIQDVARYVDRKMREFADNTTNKSPVRIAILAALNIADELLKERQEGQNDLSRVEQRASDIISLLDEKLPD